MNNQIEKIGFNNGQFQCLSKITIPVDNLAIARSYAVYEFFRINKGIGFYMHRHLDRFYKSLIFLKLEVNFNKKEIEEVIAQMIAANHSNDYYIKIFAIPKLFKKPLTPADLYIFPAEMPTFAPEIYKNGTSLLMKEYCRFLPEAKSTNYIASVYWQAEMDEINAVDVLFVNQNQVFESSRGNVFIVKNNEVSTPDSNMLKGITRSIVLDLMQTNNITFNLKPISTEKLFEADELFITSTTKLIMPIVKINDKTIGNGHPGSITEKISELYNNLLI